MPDTLIQSEPMTVPVAHCTDCEKTMHENTIVKIAPIDGSPVREFCPHCDNENITYETLVGCDAESFLLPF